MSDWMADAWQEFANAHCGEISGLSKQTVLLLKEAWLHGARTAHSKAQAAVDEFTAKTREIA